MGANTYGRQVVIPLTNKSGAGVIAGDVVIVDTGNNDAFTTNTAANFTGGVGIAQETIANNGTGRILTAGYAALVNVNASVTRGHYGATFTVAKQATDAGATRGVGTFCQFLTAGATPDALVYPVDLLGSSLTNPMTTKGDIIQANTGGTPVALAAGTSGQVLTSGGAAAYSAWAAPIPTVASARVETNESTSSATYTDLATSGPAVTVTVPASGKVRVSIGGQLVNDGRVVASVGVTLSGANTAAASDTYALGNGGGNSNTNNAHIGITFVLTGLAAGSTTFTLKYKSDGSYTVNFLRREIIVEAVN